VEAPKNFYRTLLPWFTLFHVTKFGQVLTSEVHVQGPAMKKNAEFSEGG